MSQKIEEGPLREAAILTRSVESVLRKFVRLLLGRMTLVKLLEMVRIVFVEEAEEKLKKETPGKNIPLTNLALATGLDTRTLQKITDRLEKNPDIFQDKNFLRKSFSEAALLDLWSSNERYVDQASNAPMVLKIKGPIPSFESLASEAVLARGVTTKSLILNLTRSNSIEIDTENQTIRMLSKQFRPQGSEASLSIIRIGLGSVGNLLSTIIRNMESLNSVGEPFFQRTNWTTRLDIKDLNLFRDALRKSLVSAESNAIDTIGRFEKDESQENQITAGFEIFYFEDETTY